MSRAIAIYHGSFGRAGLYQLNRPILTHAHREGHLVFHAGGPAARVGVGEAFHECSQALASGVNPWQPHSFVPPGNEAGSLCLVLYVNPSWFPTRPGRSTALRFGRADIPVSPAIARLVGEVTRLLPGGRASGLVDRLLFELTAASFEESWRGRDPDEQDPEGVRDYRVRKSIQILSEIGGAGLCLDGVARQAGLSRPHFYKLFRQQTGITPNIYLKTLLMERAIAQVAGSNLSVTEIGFELGFSSQSGFTRFFAAHVGMAPTNYRQVAHVRPH
ncbi:helix-turn-helix transcriptional regulator [Enterovirga sp. CN4-39]|uniref:helix-turn-helix transcriptional regulator n=1 Tax=Enterovirga sp. CN4-39 TaxID=3400910 RepID=UPI003C107B37